VANRSPTSSLYLDQKDWIALAQLRAGKPGPDRFRAAAVALTARISTGDLFTPISESHFVETGRSSNPKQRQEVATTMILVSRRSALAPLHTLWPQESDVFFGQRFGTPVEHEPEPFGKGLAFALGYTDDDYNVPWSTDTPEATIAMTEMFAIAEPNRKGMSEADIERERRRDEWTKVMTEAADSLVADRWKYDEQNRLAALTFQMLGGGLLDRAIGHDVQEPFLDFIRHEGFWAVIREMPTLAVYTELHRLRYPNVERPWERNDYNDIRFLSPALAYCSAVCCDNYWGDLAQRSEYITGRGVIIATGRLGMASALAKLEWGGR
jgi:hypothetical protein